MGMPNKASVRIIRMRKVPFMDQTGIHNLESLVRSSQADNIQVILSGVNSNVHAALLHAEFESILSEEYICPNINAALDKAREFITR